MRGFAEEGPVPTDGHCLWCGRKLRPFVGVDGPSGRGYYGDGTFCTLACGYYFGRRLAELGRRLTDRRA